MKFLTSVLFLCLFSIGSLSAQERLEKVAVKQQPAARIEIPQADLPPSVQKDIFKNYSTSTLVEAFKFLNEEGEIAKYAVFFNTDGRDFKIEYDSEGKAMKSEENPEKMEKSEKVKNKRKE